MQITITLEQLGKFLKRVDKREVRSEALFKLLPILEDSLKKNDPY